MYLKVPYNAQKQIATVEEVSQAIQRIAPDAGLTVDDGVPTAHYPFVNFPDGFPYDEYKRIEAALNALGFEAY